MEAWAEGRLSRAEGVRLWPCRAGGVGRLLRARMWAARKEGRQERGGSSGLATLSLQPVRHGHQAETLRRQTEAVCCPEGQSKRLF